MPDFTIPLRIVIVAPPPGVDHCMQDNKGVLVNKTRSTGDDITFDFQATVKPSRKTGEPNFTGPFAKGTPAKRFFYVNIGTLAGQTGTEWERRAKVWIADVSWKTIEEVASDPSLILVARYPGTEENGEPSCATVKLFDGGWMPGNR